MEHPRKSRECVNIPSMRYHFASMVFTPLVAKRDCTTLNGRERKNTNQTFDTTDVVTGHFTTNHNTAHDRFGSLKIPGGWWGGKG